METVTKKEKIKQVLKEYGRVLRLTKKPNMTEFKSIVKVSALGMAVIGFMGFAITMLRELIF